MYVILPCYVFQLSVDNINIKELHFQIPIGNLTHEIYIKCKRMFEGWNWMKDILLITRSVKLFIL